MFAITVPIILIFGVILALCGNIGYFYMEAKTRNAGMPSRVMKYPGDLLKVHKAYRELMRTIALPAWPAQLFMIAFVGVIILMLSLVVVALLQQQ